MPRKYPPGSRPSREQSLAATKANVEETLTLKKALKLRLAGASWDGIASVLNEQPRRIRELVDASLREAWQGDATHLLAQECDRLDALQAAYWAKAMAGDIAAARLVMDVSRERRDMLGISKVHLPPPPPDPSLTRPVIKIEIQRTETPPVPGTPKAEE